MLRAVSGSFSYCPKLSLGTSGVRMTSCPPVTLKNVGSSVYTLSNPVAASVLPEPLKSRLRLVPPAKADGAAADDAAHKANAGNQRDFIFAPPANEARRVAPKRARARTLGNI